MEKFDSFDFESSSAWKRYEEDSVLTTDADALLLAKAKWYKKNVDEGFDVDLVRKSISSRGGGGGGGAGAAAKAASGSGSSSSRSAPAAPAPTTTNKKTTTATPPPRPPPRTPAAASRSRMSLLSSLSPRALLSTLASASPADAAALASRLATLATGLAFLLACAASWLSLFGINSSKLLPGGQEGEDYYSPRRGRRAASASAAAFRKFALSASVSHFAALVQQCGSPPLAAAFPNGLGSCSPQALGPVLAWLRRASEAPDAALLFFLMLSSSSPSAAAAVPSLVAALLSLLESSANSSGSSSGGKLLGRVLFPGPVRPFLQEPGRQRKARSAAAASELAQGLWLILSTILGRGGGFLTAMGFWRTYVPMRLRSGSGAEFRAAAVGLAGGAAKAARKVGGGGGAGGAGGLGGVAAFFERLEARLRVHSD